MYPVNQGIRALCIIMKFLIRHNYAWYCDVYSDMI